MPSTSLSNANLARCDRGSTSSANSKGDGKLIIVHLRVEGASSSRERATADGKSRPPIRAHAAVSICPVAAPHAPQHFRCFLHSTALFTHMISYNMMTASKRRETSMDKETRFTPTSRCRGSLLTSLLSSMALTSLALTAFGQQVATSTPGVSQETSESGGIAEIVVTATRR